MKIKSKNTICLFFAIVIVCAFTLTSCGATDGGMSYYGDNPDMDKEVNDEIKAVVLQAMKDVFIVNSTAKQQYLTYTTSAQREVIQLDEDVPDRLFFIAEKDFMKKFESNDGETYAAVIQTYYPEYFCHVTVINEDGYYKISRFQLDI